MKFTINNKDYSLNNRFNTVSLEQAINIVNVDIEEDDLKYLMLSNEIEYEKKYINYMINVLKELTDCNVLDKIDDIYIVVLFNEVKQIVKSLFYMNFEKYIPQGIKEFKFKGVKYKFPQSLNINNEEIFFYNEPSKNVIDVSNLLQVISDMENKGVELMPVLCAIYLRKDDEEILSDKLIAERSELFKQLPLSYAYEVFFCTYYYLNSYLISSKTYSIKKKRRQIKERIKNLILGFFKSLNKGLREIKKKLKN